MEYKSIKIESYVGTELNLELSVQNSDTLVVLLPGSGYTIFGPSLFYAYSMSCELGYDVLSIEYGYQKINLNFQANDLDKIINECKQAVEKAVLDGNYKKIVFIAKSLGTKIMVDLLDVFQEFQTVPVFITPSNRAIDRIREIECLVVIGTRDPLFKYIDINELLQLDNVKLFLVEAGDHFLDVGEFIQSIEYMKLSTIRIRDYLLSRL